MGSSAITAVYQGNDLVWSGGTPAPAWPAPYYYPSEIISNRGMGLFFENIPSGYTITYKMTSDDCEGEGGDLWLDIIGKTESSRGFVLEGATIRLYFSKDYENTWIGLMSDYEARINELTSGFTSCKAMFYKRKDGSCGNVTNIPTALTWTNIELLVDCSAHYNEGSTNIPFSTLVQRCPNLKYIALNETNSGQTLTLTGSTNWTAESMKFTEWYCPNTTFIIENNSWWRSRIDWDIAAKRNITFKDPNGNIITQ